MDARPEVLAPPQASSGSDVYLTGTKGLRPPAPQTHILYLESESGASSYATRRPELAVLSPSSQVRRASI